MCVKITQTSKFNERTGEQETIIEPEVLTCECTSNDVVCKHLRRVVAAMGNACMHCGEKNSERKLELARKIGLATAHTQRIGERVAAKCV